MNRGLMFLIVLCGAGIWYVAFRLSPETLALCVGFVLGALSGLPMALLMLASQRKEQTPSAPSAYPPVIMVDGHSNYGGYQQYQAPPQLPQLPSNTYSSAQESDW